MKKYIIPNPLTCLLRRVNEISIDSCDDHCGDDARQHDCFCRGTEGPEVPDQPTYEPDGRSSGGRGNPCSASMLPGANALARSSPPATRRWRWRSRARGSLQNARVGTQEDPCGDVVAELEKAKPAVIPRDDGRRRSETQTALAKLALSQSHDWITSSAAAFEGVRGATQPASCRHLRNLPRALSANGLCRQSLRFRISFHPLVAEGAQSPLRL